MNILTRCVYLVRFACLKKYANDLEKVFEVISEKKNHRFVALQ